MIRYYQLTPEILLEYICDGEPKLNEDGIKGNKKDIFDDNTSTTLLKSNAFGTKYLFFRKETGGFNSLSNLVLPLNATETQFVVAKSEYQKFYDKLNASNRFSSKSGSGYIYEDTNYDENIRLNNGSDSDDSDSDDNNGSCDVRYDKCIVHFTSRNFFGNYDSLIFQTYVYMNNKNKLYFASFLFKKTSDLKMKAEHFLYNGKLYTTQIDFDIPSISAIFSQKNVDFNNALKSQGVNLLENTPIGINVYGVSGSVLGIDNYVKLKTHKINSVSIPYVYNKLDEIYIDIKESDVGDYYIIQTKMGSGYSSFVDYITHMGEDIRKYVIMHELSLKEVWVENNGVSHSEITHKEFHIIDVNEDDENVEIEMRFKESIKYRPICVNSGRGYKAIIMDTLKVINTVDSSAYEVTSSLDIDNPYKYGNRLMRLGIKNESRPIVNVYNKKASDEKNTGSNGISLSRGGGFVVENNTQNITSFIECANIGVSILELSPEDIN